MSFSARIWPARWLAGSAGAQTVVADARLRAKKNEPAPGGLAEWKEGKLFPEGWEKMPLPQKVCHSQEVLPWMIREHATAATEGICLKKVP